MIFAPVAPVYQAMFTSPNMALESAMACRVFRGVRLGLIKDSTTHDVGTLRLTQRSHPARIAPANGYAFESQDFKGPRHSLHVSVEISGTTESPDPLPTPGRKSGQVYEYEFTGRAV